MIHFAPISGLGAVRGLGATTCSSGTPYAINSNLSICMDEVEGVPTGEIINTAPPLTGSGGQQGANTGAMSGPGKFSLDFNSPIVIAGIVAGALLLMSRR